MSIAAIETTVFGVNMRSRLEARWAIVFTALGWRWDYEAIDLPIYQGRGKIPDFLMHWKYPTLIEVKPAHELVDLQYEREMLVKRAEHWLCDDAEARLRELDSSPEPADEIARRADLMEIDDLVGFLTTVRMENDNSLWHRGRRVLVAGGQLFEPTWAWAHLVDVCTLDGAHLFARCPGCPVLGLFNRRGCLVCGRDSARPEPVTMTDMMALWREAGNRVQWKPQDAVA